MRELNASGRNLATNSFESGLWFWRLGPPLMKAQSEAIERARSIDLTLRKTRGPTTFELGVFHQDIDN